MIPLSVHYRVTNGDFILQHLRFSGTTIVVQLGTNEISINYILL